MTYNSKLTSLHAGLTPIHADQDRLNFAPKLAEDISIIDENGNEFKLNKIYTSADTSYPDLEGTIWVVSDIEGWWNIPEPEIPDIRRGFGDGSFDISGRYATRDLTLTGSILIESSNKTTINSKNVAARKKLLELINLVKRSTWIIVNEDNFRRAAYVRLNGRPDLATVNSRGRINFSISLRAGDPVKYEWLDTIPSNLISSGLSTIDGNGYRYSEITDLSSFAATRRYLRDTTSNVNNAFRNYNYDTTTFDNSYRNYSGDVFSSSSNPNQVSVFNYGDTNVYCLFRITGPLYGPALIKNYSTGQEINIIYINDSNNSAILNNSNEYLDIETRSRGVARGNYSTGVFEGNSRAVLETLVDWIYLQPGENLIMYNDFGTQNISQRSTLQIYWRSGWIG